MPSSEIRIRELKNQTNAVLRRLRAGETIVVTDRGRAVALLVPGPRVGCAATRLDGCSRIGALAAAGRLSWSGGKPRGLARGPRVDGRRVADAAIADRR